LLEEKATYTIRDLFDNLDISIREFSRISGVNEVTLARIRDGKSTYRSTANKVLNSFSVVYNRQLGMHNVTGVNVQISRRPKGRGNKGQSNNKPSTNVA
jgi:predicted transcriptional regulator